MQALTLHLQQIGSSDYDDASLHRRLASANELATTALNAARKSVNHLREQEQCGDLARSLAEVIDHLQRHYAVAIRLSKSGKEQQLQSAACEEALAIAKEAILNALKHAHATVIEVELHFAPRALELVVRDDGIGIDAQLISQRETEGHWGLRGMHERAAALGGVLKIQAGAPCGTEIVLRLSPSFTYAGH
jgi:signal transduction histidine kinase